jgi:hypothetical protein
VWGGLAFRLGRHHFYRHLPGRYLFNLTPGVLNTRQFPNGAQLIAVNAADRCWDQGMLTEHVAIDNIPARAAAAAS